MVTRGFVGRRQPPETGARLPPGQYLTDDFPILQIGPNPTVDLATWTFTLRAGSRPIKAWSWAEFEALPRTTWKGDIHCVTKWSKFDTTWEGVSFDDLTIRTLDALRYIKGRLSLGTCRCTWLGIPTHTPETANHETRITNHESRVMRTGGL